jgi:spore coat protein A
MSTTRSPRRFGAFTRREFLDATASAAAAGLTVRGGLHAAGRDSTSVAAHTQHAKGILAAAAPGALDLATLTRFVDPLPIPPVVRPGAGATQRLAMRAIECCIHRDLPPTRMWSFGSTFPGPTIEARRGQAFSIEWANELPATHFLPIDRNIHGAGAGVPDVRAVVHVHGARMAPDSDGMPEQWFVPGPSARAHYPNEQEATLWYHDHTMGINRLNVFAGLLGPT